MLFYGFLAILIFAFVPLAIKFTVATALTICLFRLFITVSLLGFFWRRKIQFRSLEPGSENFKVLCAIGLFFFVHWLTYSYAVKIGGASIVVLGLSTYGIQLILLGFIFLKHRLTRKDLLCLLASFIGLLMIVPGWDFRNEKTFGLMLALISATAFAILPVLHKKLHHINEETRIFSQFFFAFLAFLFFTGETHWSLSLKDWGILFFLGVGGTLLAHSFWARISSRVSPVVTGVSYYTIAPITILFSHLFFDETLTHLQGTGALIVIASAIINVVKIS